MLTHGNLKLSKCIAGFGISAGVTGSCPQSCERCYALKLENLRPHVKLARARNFALAQSPWFAQLMCKEIALSKVPIKYVRVHEGGEFFNKEYVNSWHYIAVANPKITFYAYTCLPDEKYNVGMLKSLKNFVLINSIMQDGKKNYGKLADLEKRGYIGNLCRAKNGECGKSCRFCMTKIAQNFPPVFEMH